MFKIILIIGLAVVLVNFVLWVIGLKKVLTRGFKDQSTRKYLACYAIFLVIIILIAFGGFGAFWFYQSRRPSSIAAFMQARTYLKSQHGKSHEGWRISTKENHINPDDPVGGYCLVEYKYAGKSGVLKATYVNEGHFVFSEYESESGANKTSAKIEKIEVAYTFLLKKMARDRLNLIASKDDENLELIQDIIRSNRLDLEVEGFNNIEEGPDLCHYSKTSNRLVAIIDVAKMSEKNYYVSYYLGPEGGASKEIVVEKIDEKWAVVNDDGMWSVK
jgi:hypothetical protein